MSLLLKIAQSKKNNILLKISTPLDDIIPFDKKDSDIPFTTDRAQHSKADWISSIKMLENNIIMILIDLKKLSLEQLKDFAAIWDQNISLDLSAEDFSDPKSPFTISLYREVFENRHSKIFGDREILKLNFPGVWSRISNILSQKNIKEEECLYMFFDNSEVDVSKTVLRKDPFYFGHDLYHADGELLGGIAFSDFDKVMDKIMSNLAKCYVRVDDQSISLFDDYADGSSKRGVFDLDIYNLFAASLFRGTISAPTDIIGDVYALYLAGKDPFHPTAPQFINLRDYGKYQLNESLQVKQLADKEYSKFREFFKRYFSKGYRNLYSEGAGKVVFNNFR